MKALVTGASGFIGSHVVRHLLARGVEVRGFMLASTDQRNLRGLDIERGYGTILDQDTVRRAVEGCDAVYHLAALYAHWAADPRQFYAVNVNGTRNVFEACLAAGTPRVVHTSSIATLDLPGNGAIATEANASDRRRVAEPYRHSKRLAECVARECHRRGLPVTIVCPATPIGTGDSAPTPTARLVLRYLEGWMGAVYPSGGSNFIDVEDCALGHVLAAERGRPGETYILGGKNLTYREIVEMLARITGFAMPRLRVPPACVLGAAYVSEIVSRFVTRQPPWTSLEDARHTAEHRYVDSSKAINELGLPRSDPYHALAKAVRWFLDNGYVRTRRRALALRRRLAAGAPG